MKHPTPYLKMQSSAKSQTKRLTELLCAGLILGFGVSVFAAEKGQVYQVGVAKVDITPSYPIRLSGYAVRKTESQGVTQKLWAKALAIGSDKEGPAILLTVDNTGVPAHVRNEVARRLQQKKKIQPDRVALCSTHTHSAPCLAGNLPTLFGEPMPPEHLAHVERYTRELVDALEQVALAALKDRHAARLSWGQTQAGFAANRRTPGGPVDHDLPVLVATDKKGKLRAVLANYACHCTTLVGDQNQICGDWAGYAQEYLERDHPGAVVLVAIGCGADANPQPRGAVELAKQHGAEIATNVNRLLDAQERGRVTLRTESGAEDARTPDASRGRRSQEPRASVWSARGFSAAPAGGQIERHLTNLTSLRGGLVCQAKQIELAFDTLPTRAEWEERARETNYTGYHGRRTLAKLDRGETLPTTLPYFVQTWTIGDTLAMVFLPGEVVVDFSLRLKREFDHGRLWVNAYANDVPCYIPSRRIWQEGGYEGGGAMIFYGQPTRLAADTEDRIVNAVHELMPKVFLADVKNSANLPASK